MDIEKCLSSINQPKDNWNHSMGIADNFLSLKKSSPYLDIEVLTKMISDKSKTQAERWFADNCISQINKNGNESIVHLCISPRITRSLIREGVETISGLKIFLMTGRNTWDGIFGHKARIITQTRLDLFNQQLQRTK
jgi:hypothetical protein